MKKTLSVFLAIVMLVLTAAPAFAAGSYTVTFMPPQIGDPDAYKFVKSVNGENIFVEVTDIDLLSDAEKVGYYYVKYIKTPADPERGRPEVAEYYVYNDILFDDDKAPYDKALADYLADPSVADADRDYRSRRYVPASFAFGGTSFAANSVVSFKVMTNEVYDVNTVVVTINGAVAPKNQYGEYTALVDRNLTISVLEKDENGTPLLLPNYYTMTLTSGDGYYVKTLKGENNRVIPYGGSFKFRVKLVKGYSGNGMKVYALAGDNTLGNLIGEDFDAVRPLIEKAEPLTSIGVDEDGCRIYELNNIKANTKIIVSGVQEESKVGVLAMLKRILRTILHALGIHLPFLDEGILAFYKVKVENTAGPGVTCNISAAAKNDDYTEFDVLAGEGVTVTLTTTEENHNYNVKWAYYSDDNFTELVSNGPVYNAVWTKHYNSYTGVYTWMTSYYIEGINNNVKITIE